MGNATKVGLDAVKTASKKVFHKTAQPAGEFIGHKTAENIVKAKPLLEVNLRNAEEIVLLQEKKQEILNELREVS